MDLTLVPFGYHESDQRLVDVHQVPSGKACGCSCPSCKAPLIARKGTKKVWHFAHDSKSEIRNQLEKCNYSFFVSARMMALQLVGEQLTINLPASEVTLSEHNISITETVTQSRQVQIENISLNRKISGVNVDLLGNIDGYALAIIFGHPGREKPGEIVEILGEKVGVVEISLDTVKDKFVAIGASENTFSEILYDFIADDFPSKRWLYHPRYQQVIEIAKSKLSDKLQSERKRIEQRTLDINSIDFDGLNKFPASDNLEIRFKFDCRLCNSSWTGIGNVEAECKKCGSSLLVSRSDIPRGET